MKLRNKKTGEIGLVHCDATMFSNKIGVFIDNNHIDLRNPYKIYTSLAELNEEWEDYEEPTTYYYVSDFGAIREGDVGKFVEDEIARKEIGNYFETKEEAERAVEKLKCFTNLKNHEFMFDGWYYGTDGNIVILANAHEFNDMEEQDLTKVFGEKIC